MAFNFEEMLVRQNVELIQRAQSKILRKITGAPWYVRNEVIHRDLNMLLVKELFNTINTKYFNKLASHNNQLTRNLREEKSTSRLKTHDRPTTAFCELC